jgi:hypothetical protein
VRNTGFPSDRYTIHPIYQQQNLIKSCSTMPSALLNSKTGGREMASSKEKAKQGVPYRTGEKVAAIGVGGWHLGVNEDRIP